VDVSSTISQKNAMAAMAHAKWISDGMGNGRLDTYTAVQSWIATTEQK
jgi:hypothetical protein